MNNHNDFDALWRIWNAPEPPHDLAGRIVQRAMHTAQKPSIYNTLTWGDLLSLLLVPRPVLAMGFCLVIGVCGGWVVTPVSNTDTSVDSDSTLNLIMVEEDWL
ncbi:MAG: hypothetical protein ACK4NR_11225 [Micavibrio sp.]